MLINQVILLIFKILFIRRAEGAADKPSLPFIYPCYIRVIYAFACFALRARPARLRVANMLACARY
jgi:hypothetical protein